MTEAAPQSFLDGRVVLHAGDCLDVLERMPASSVDAVITDPPYHFETIVKRYGAEGAAPAGHGTDGVYARASAGFMGRQWDGGDIAFRPETWAKAMRVLKPGGMLAAFSAPKCYHKMAFAIEAAGFEIRDRIVHLYDPGEREAAFLESLSAAQAEALLRIVEASDPLGDLFWTFGSGFPKGHDVAKAIDRHLGVAGRIAATGEPVRRMIPGAEQNRSGWEKTDGREYQPGQYVPGSAEAAAWEGWNVALKPAYEPIALARKPLAERSVAAQVLKTGTGGINVGACRIEAARGDEPLTAEHVHGNQSREHYRTGVPINMRPLSFGRWPADLTHDGSAAVLARFPDQDGSAARFFYTAKAGVDDRLGSGHPTVKPLALMRWLVRLLCPAGGTLLDPFAGTGTTAEAAHAEGFRAILIEREPEHLADIARRMALVTEGAGTRRRAAAKARAERRKETADAGPLFGAGAQEAAE